MIFGGYFMWIAIFGVNQAVVQRYVSMPSKRDVPKSVPPCVISNKTKQKNRTRKKNERKNE